MGTNMGTDMGTTHMDYQVIGMLGEITADFSKKSLFLGKFNKILINTKKNRTCPLVSIGCLFIRL